MIFWLIGIPNENLVVYLINMVIALGICILVGHIRRIQKGIQFFEEEKALGLGLAISGVVYILTSVELRDYYGKHIVFATVIIPVVF